MTIFTVRRTSVSRVAFAAALPFAAAGFAWIAFALARYALSDQLDYRMTSFETYMEAVLVSVLAYCAAFAAVLALAATLLMISFALAACDRAFR